MKTYVGVKMIDAKPMNLGEYNEYRNWTIPDNEDPTREGYLVEYEDGYQSWSPKEAFESAYMEFSDPSRVTDLEIKRFIGGSESNKIGDRTVITEVKLINGFSLIETGQCVDPNNFNMDKGHEVAVERVKSKMWALLGFVLSWARNGIKGGE